MHGVSSPGSGTGGEAATPSLRERRAALLARRDLVGSAFCRPFATEVDQWLAGLAGRASGNDPHGLALLAVGGYGRGELCPFSDLDLVLVHSGRRAVAEVADAIWYPVWDQGIQLDHSVRRPREVIDTARQDLRVALGLLDGRVVWGDARLAVPLLAEAVERWRSELGARWLPDLEAQMVERHRANGEVAYLLEPELKESHGGLRDVNVWQAIAQYAPRLAEHVDVDRLQRAATVLTDVRVELHRATGRPQDRLALQDQDQVAAALGEADADALMARVAEAGSTIAWASDDAWRRRPLWQPELPGRRRGRGRRTEPSAPTPPATPDRTEPGVLVEGGEVTVAADAPIAADPSLPLRAAAVAAEHDLPMAHAALERLATDAPPPTVPWPGELRGALVRMLATGQPAIAAVQALDHYGLWVRALPEWEPVRNRPQRNAYHRFTVDRHLLEAAANAAGLAGGVDRPDLLLVGALFHDIGKGYPGDHTDVGVTLLGEIGRRIGFPTPDVAVLQQLVRHHLLLPDTATRRDLDDPATIERVAAAVGDRTTLQLLAALTEADSVATGPSAWGAWKAGLVGELVHRVERYLADGQAPRRRGWVTPSDHALMDAVRRDGHLAVTIEPPRVLVAAPDRPGLLSSVAGVLALHGVSVRSADVASEDGVALEAFFVDAPHGRWPDAAAVARDVNELMSRSLVLRDRLAAKARAYAPRRPAAARPLQPQIVVDNQASATATVLEVRAPDEIGLLHRVTRALVDCALDVVSARVATIGSEVVDAFYVRDSAGRKVEDPAGLASVHAALARAIGAPDVAGDAQDAGVSVRSPHAAT